MMIPKNRPTHPGKFIQEDILNECHLSQTQLSMALGVSRHLINQLVNEQRQMTADMALRLGRFTQTSPELWLNLQQAVDLWEASHSPNAEKIIQIKPFRSEFSE